MARWRLEQAKFMPAIGMSPGTGSQTGTNPSHISPRAGEDSDSSDESDSDNDDNDSQLALHASTPASTDDEVLGLPSDFNAEERKLYDIELLGDYETKLRIGQAFDLLEKIREAVKHLSAFIEEKKEAHAVADHVRSNDITKFSIAYCRKLSQTYNSNFDRLVALRGLPSTFGGSHPASRLQRIDFANDLTVTNLKKAREQGDHERSGSWIWTVFEDVMDCVDIQDTSHQLLDANETTAHSNVASEDRALKQVSGRRTLYTTWCTYLCAIFIIIFFLTCTFSVVDRAQWFRAWQEKCRYDEAVNILCAEFRATRLGFAAMGDLWRAAAEREDLSRGERAYAWQHYSMFKRLSKEAQEAYDIARKKGVPAEQLDHTRVRAFSTPSVGLLVDSSQSIRRYLALQAKDISVWDSILKTLDHK